MAKSEEELRLRTCGAKVRYCTKLQAERAVDIFVSISNNKQHAYLCPYCHFWHVGRKKVVKPDAQHAADPDV